MPMNTHGLKWLEQITPASVINKVARADNVFSLGIGLSQRCNYRCPHCYYHQEHAIENINDMPLSLLSKIMAEMPKLQSVILGLEGEPFLYPHIFQALEIAAEKTDNLLIVSNGSLLTSTICNTLKNFPVRNLCLSIDAATKQGYENIRIGGNFDTFKKNCANAIHALGERVSFHAVVFEENLPFLGKLPALAAEFGIRKISFQQLRVTQSILRRKIHPAMQKHLFACLENVANEADHFCISLYFDKFFANAAVIKFLDTLSTEHGCINIQANIPQYCESIYKFTSILSDGSIFPCCGDFKPGKIKAYTFDGIFNHKYLQMLRYLDGIGYPLQPCAICRHKSQLAN